MGAQSIAVHALKLNVDSVFWIVPRAGHRETNRQIYIDKLACTARAKVSSSDYIATVRRR